MIAEVLNAIAQSNEGKATLVETADVSTSLDELRFQGVPRARFEDWCRTVGATTLATTPRRWQA